MRRNIPMFPLKDTAVFLLKLLILAVIVGGVTYGVSTIWAKFLPDGIAKALASITPDTPSNFKPDIARLRIALRIVVSGFAGLVTFLAASFLLRLKEPRQMLEWTLAKVKHKKAPNAPTDAAI